MSLLFDSSPDDLEESTVARGYPTYPPADQGAPKEPEFHVIVFRGDSSYVFPLPSGGQITIGRSERCQLRIDDPSVSREHAKITISLEQSKIADCGSQNGTRVNGERVIGSRALISGDAITICDTTLVFYSRARSQPRARETEFTEFRRQAEIEIDRSLRHQRPLTLAAIIVGAGTVDRPAIFAAIEPVVRRSDTATWDGPDRLLLLLPETTADDAHELARRLLNVIQAAAPDARVGYAYSPRDGCDPDTLVANARAAARFAAPGEVVPAHGVSRTVEIGERSIVVADPAMLRAYELIERLAASDLPVLIHGETGTGKELAASALHHWSKRKNGPLIALNCAALPESLIESELFGFQRGAFTGADNPKPGMFEASHGGTFFLDEIGDLPLGAQAKLLRVLESKRITRLGEFGDREIDVRVVAATHRNLEAEVAAGRFRQDLYFRLAAGVLWIPPLRDRTLELSMLAQAFLTNACSDAAGPAKTISDPAMQRLAAYSWPGNVRELKNLMEYFAATILEPVIEPHHLDERLRKSAPPSPPPAIDDASDDDSAPRSFRPIREVLDETEKRQMITALEAAGGNQTRAAELIQMPLRTFQTKVRKYGIR